MERNMELEWNFFSCCLCLDLLKNPVTTPCGHSYCSECIKQHWDVEEDNRIYSCPQCRRRFTPKPVLENSTMLAALVEALEKALLPGIHFDHRYAGAEDVACDVCTGRRLKAVRSCLVCRTSYCNAHLQPHLKSSAFRRHKLVRPTQEFPVDNCAEHNELLVDTEPLNSCCYCSLKEHKEQKQLVRFKPKEVRKKIQQRIQDRETDLKVLQNQMRCIENKIVQVGEEQEVIVAELIELLKRRLFDAQEQVRCSRIAEESRVREHQRKLEEEIAELKKNLVLMDSTKLEGDSPEFNLIQSLLSRSEDYNLESHPQGYFEDVRADFSEFRDALLKVLKVKHTDISSAVSSMNVSEPEPEPRRRQDFLRHSRLLTLDLNTINEQLVISHGNRTAKYLPYGYEPMAYGYHPDRFLGWPQVMSKESLAGRCYLEVERDRVVFVAVSYWTINRAVRSKKGAFGSDDKSWCLQCFKNGFQFSHNGIKTAVEGPLTSRVGVYLDHSAGLLSFYSIIDGTMEHLHTVHTTFTRPLHVGLMVDMTASAELCVLGSTELNSWF